MNVETGELVPARCGRNGCWYCLPLNARRRVLAVAMMRPTRTATITNAADPGDPDPWQTIRRRYNRTREYLTRMGVDPGWWSVFGERGSETGMVHVHIAQHGPKKLPKEALQEAAHKAGAGWTRVESVRDPGDLSAYGLKGFVADGEEPAKNLELNGGRLGHFSRGFFTSSEGETLGVRAAEKLAAELARGDEAGSWVLVRSAASAGPAVSRV
jgi:hypothetical protein